MRTRRRLMSVGLILGLSAPLTGGVAAAQAAPITLTAPASIQAGRSVTLQGTISGAAAGTTVTIVASPYPYRSAEPLGTTATSATGTFAFTATPDRNTRYTASLGPPGALATVSVGVIGKVVTRLRALSLGRAEVTLDVSAPAGLRWAGTRVHWSFASGRHGRFLPTPTTRAIAVGPSIVRLRTIVTLPAGPYEFRACLSPPGWQALLSPRRPPGCHGRGDHGGSALPDGFPSTAAINRAAGYLASRGGRWAFAVVDSEGRLAGVNAHARFWGASIVKVMLLVAYLRRLDAAGRRRIDPYSASFLYPMIHISDNSAATVCQSYVGDGGMYAVAHLAGMTDFSVSGSWLSSQTSPADQARFFFELPSLIPREFVGYVRSLLEGIEPSQTWGLAPVARSRGYRAFFKDGSGPTAAGQLVSQADWLEGHGRRFTVVGMTDGDPTMAYGEQSLSGLAASLL